MKQTAVVFVVFVIWLVSGCSLQSLPAEDSDVKAALMDVLDQYQYRAKLVAELIAAVHGEAKRQQQIRESVAAVQSQLTAIPATPVLLNDSVAFQRFEVGQRQLTDSLSRLLIAIDDDRRLADDSECHRLKVLLSISGRRIAGSRNRYDQAVEHYNAALDLFPNTAVASVLGYGKRPTFSVPDQPALRHPPRVDFGSLRGSLRV